MWCVLAKAGEAPAAGVQSEGQVLRFEPHRTDPRGWRLAELVAAERHIPLRKLFLPVRCRAEIALARQLAMYLMHTHYGRLYADVGRFFGRDRTTVSHACAVIEEMREVAEFNMLVLRLEAALADEAAHDREAADAAAR